MDVAVEGIQGVGELVEALAGLFEDAEVVFGEGGHGSGGDDVWLLGLDMGGLRGVVGKGRSKRPGR